MAWKIFDLVIPTYWECEDIDGLTLSWRRSLSYKNRSIDLLCKPMDWFLYDRDRPHEIVKQFYFACELAIIYIHTSQLNWKLIYKV